MLNAEENEIEVQEETMPKKKRKRIYNPKTKRYYQIRQRSSSKGQKGTIMGTWKPPIKKKRRKRK